jgi:TPR repeat protein
MHFYRKAADRNYANAQLNIGLLYLHDRGAGKDKQKAEQWFREAVKHENAGAQVELGMFYYNGIGRSKNYHEAEKRFQKAAAQGNALAIYIILGRCTTIRLPRGGNQVSSGGRSRRSRCLT